MTMMMMMMMMMEQQPFTRMAVTCKGRRVEKTASCEVVVDSRGTSRYRLFTINIDSLSCTPR